VTSNTGARQIRVGKTRRECTSWTGDAVVVDVLRCSTTITSLAAAGKSDITVFAHKEKALALKAEKPEADFFSELAYPSDFRHFDNSPHQALTLSDKNTPAIIVTGAGTKAMIGAKKARTVTVGCFANFPYLIDYIRQNLSDVLVIPAGLFYLNHFEDFACSQAIREAVLGEKHAAENAIAAIRHSGRVEKFLHIRPENGRQDLAIAFNIGGLKAVAGIAVKKDRGEVRVLRRGD